MPLLNRTKTCVESEIWLSPYSLGKEVSSFPYAKDLAVLFHSSQTYNDYAALTVSVCIARVGQINRVKDPFNGNTQIHNYYECFDVQQTILML